MGKKRAAAHVKVTSLCEYLTHVQEIHAEWEAAESSWIDPWFRGVSNADYGLLPGFYRPTVVASRKEYDLEEDDYRLEFRLKAAPYLQNMQADSEWDQYCLMQHYGLPTRLLDWSESALVALFFAVGYEGASGSDAAVWMLNPWWFNRLMAKEDCIFFTWERLVRRYLPPLFSSRRPPKSPLAVQAPYNSPRITAQRGLFTVHGKVERPLEEFCAESRTKPRLVKIVIELQHVCTVRRQLRTAGITATSIFPELEGLCRELRQDWTELPAFDTSSPARREAAIPPRRSRTRSRR